MEDADTDSGLDGGPQQEEAVLVVYQCRGCRTIIGDSLSLVTTDEEMNIITLSGGTSITVMEFEPKTVTSGIGTGSTFVDIKCSFCNAVVGREYVATVASLDHIRDMLSFHVDAISQYHIGSRGVVRGPDGHALPSATRTLGQLEEDVLQVQHLMCWQGQGLKDMTHHLNEIAEVVAGHTEILRAQHRGVPAAGGAGPEPAERTDGGGTPGPVERAATPCPEEDIAMDHDTKDTRPHGPFLQTPPFGRPGT